MDDYVRERLRREDVIEACCKITVLGDPRFTNGPASGSLPADLAGSETQTLFDDGANLLYRGRPNKALRKLRRAESMARVKYGRTSPVVAWIQNYVGAALKEMNRFSEAEVALREALAIREGTLKPDDPLIAVSLNNLGDILNQQDRGDEGLPLLARAVDIESKVYGTDSRDTMLTRTNLAEVLTDIGRRKEAIRELKKLRNGLKRHGDNLLSFGDIPKRVQELQARLGI